MNCKNLQKSARRGLTMMAGGGSRSCCWLLSMVFAIVVVLGFSAQAQGQSCDGNCDGQSSGGCWCDASCCNFGDCCADKCQFCAGIAGDCDNNGPCGTPPVGCGDPGTGDCCVDNGSPFCEDAACCDLVCGQDPFCCNNTWDSLCASDANSQCAACQQPTLAVNVNPTVCYEVGDAVSVVIEMQNMTDVVVGGQFFVSYDPASLTFVSAAPADPPSPFTVEIFESHTPGLPIYATGVDAPGGGVGTDGDAVMAKLTFTAAQDDVCDEAGLVTLMPGTLLSDEFGNAVLGVVTVDLPAITIDSTDPVLSVPGNQVFSCTPAGPYGVCDGACGGQVGSCWCDEGCAGFGDCCDNVCVACPLLTHCSPATATDNCGPPLVTFLDYVIPGACPQVATIERTWTATDCSGNSASGVQIIEVVDNTAPTPSNIPPSVTVYSDAGMCGAAVTWTPPTTTDNCTPTANITVVSSHNPGDIFPTGTTPVSYAFTDECGNTSKINFNVTVLPLSEMLVDVSLQNVLAAPFTRCVAFDLTDTDGNVIATAEHTFTFTNGSALETIEVPCGAYGGCLAARDPLHTLRSAGDLTISGTQFVADAFDPLRGGDLNDDGVVDILDFGIFVFEFNANYLTADTTCVTPFPHADISGDGIVGTADFTFISTNFLAMDELCAVTAVLGGRLAWIDPPRNKPLTRISVEELRRRDLGHLAIADLNGDGWVDETDMALFFMGVKP